MSSSELPRAVVPTWRRWIPSRANAIRFLKAPAGLALLTLVFFSGRACIRSENERVDTERAVNEALGRKYLRYTEAEEIECVLQGDGCPGATEIRCIAFIRGGAPVVVECRNGNCGWPD